jgi:hypothetical protein
VTTSEYLLLYVFAIFFDPWDGNSSTSLLLCAEFLKSRVAKMAFVAFGAYELGISLSIQRLSALALLSSMPQQMSKLNEL